MWNVLYSVRDALLVKKTYKKSAIVPEKANKEQQEQWIAEYEKLKRNLPENETIYFMDGIHLTHNVQVAYVWIKQAVRKEILSNRDGLE